MRAVPFCGFFCLGQVTAVIHIVFVKGPCGQQFIMSLVRIACKAQCIKGLQSRQRAVRPLPDVGLDVVQLRRYHPVSAGNQREQGDCGEYECS